MLIFFLWLSSFFSFEIISFTKLLKQSEDFDRIAALFTTIELTYETLNLTILWLVKKRNY